MKTRFTLSVLCLMAGSGVLLTAMILTSQSQSLSKIETPLQVADALDCLIQPRFQKDAGSFGLARIITVSGHEQGVGFFQPQDMHEKRLMKRINTAGREYVVTFLHCAHSPGSYDGQKRTEARTKSRERAFAERKPFLTHLFSVKPKTSEQEEFRPIRGRDVLESRHEKFEKLAVDAWPRLKRGKEVEANSGKWLVVMRPVTASREACLKCHEGAKAGDTLGVMVYAVSKSKTGA